MDARLYAWCHGVEVRPAGSSGGPPAEQAAAELRWAGFFLFDMQIGFGGYFDEVVEESEELRGIGARGLEAEARRVLVADIERRHGASVAPMEAVAAGGDGARGVTSGATRGDEDELDSFEVGCGDGEPDYYAQHRGFASHLAGLWASLGGDPRE